MFERYTEKARRAIFFARFEASKYGSGSIETEHLLLGLLREDNALSQRSPKPGMGESVRKEIESRITRHETIPTSVEMPLSMESRQALTFAAEEANRQGYQHIGTEHLVVGLLRVEKSMGATILKAHEVTLSGMREFMGQEATGSAPGPWFRAPKAATEDPTMVLKNFLGALRAGLKDGLMEFFAADACFTDARGRRWADKESFHAKLEELFAPFAARKAKYLIEETIYPLDRVCLASLLWEDVPLADKTPKGLCRMSVTLARRGLAGWMIYSIQITPVTRL
jgi:Clp amino terminal domain, pathogenicity island component